MQVGLEFFPGLVPAEKNVHKLSQRLTTTIWFKLVFRTCFFYILVVLVSNIHNSFSWILNILLFPLQKKCFWFNIDHGLKQTF